MEQAKINQWVNWSELNSSLFNRVTNTIYGQIKNANFSDDLAAVKNFFKKLSDQLKGKKWLVGERLTLADLTCGVMMAPAFQLIYYGNIR